MASITINVTSTPFTGSKTFTISDSDVSRLIAWANKAYATQPTQANPTPPALTPAQGLIAWATGLIEGTKANVVNTEEAASIQAVTVPAPIVTT